MNSFRRAFGHLTKEAAPAAPGGDGGSGGGAPAPDGGGSDSGAYPNNLPVDRVIAPVIFRQGGCKTSTGKKCKPKKIKKSELKKAPMSTDENMPELLQSWTAMQHGKPVKPFPGEVHTKTAKLANGLFHHVFDSSESEGSIGMGSPIRHILSAHENPNEPGHAHMYINRGPKGGNEVWGVYVDPAHKGKGFGRAIYDAAIAHHGALHSGHQVSNEAHRVWESIARDPKYKTKLGKFPEKNKSYQGASRHSVKLAASEKALFGHLRKSPYGPAGMGLYNQADNARRKMGRTSDTVAVGPNSAVRATKPSANAQAASIAAEARRKSKANPVKVYSQAEIAKLFRGGFKKPTLAKGAMRRLAPFKPTDVSTEQRSNLGVWQHQGKLEDYDNIEDGKDAAREYREMIAPMTGNVRKRMLNRLSAATKIKKHPQTGENMYLMYRGMDDDEHGASVKDHHIESGHRNNTSWTPDYTIARGFASDYTTAGNEPVAAWIPERHILAMPKMVGKQSQPQFNMDDGDYLETFDRKGPSTYSRENEVIVAHDHKSPRATVAEVNSHRNKAPANVNDAINLRSKGNTAFNTNAGYHRKLLRRLRQK